MHCASSGSRATGSSSRSSVCLRVDRRGDGSRLDLLAAREDHSGDAPVLLQQPLDAGSGPDHGAEAARGARERRRQRAEAALHEHGRAGAVAVAGRRLEQQVRGRPGRPRARQHAVDAARRNHRGHERRLEPLLREVGDRHRAPAQQVLPVLAAQPAQRPAEAREREEIAQVEPLGVGRRQLQQTGEHRGDPRERRVELGIARRVPCREAAELGGRARGVAEQAEAAPVRVRREDARLRQRPLQPVAREVERRDELRPQRTGRVRDRRGPEAGMELLRDRRAADRLATLDHDRLEAALREERRRGEPVRAAADHDDVGLHRAAPTSFSTSSAASRPGAPMIPPPGCVADPHR